MVIGPQAVVELNILEKSQQAVGQMVSVKSNREQM